MLKQFPHGLLLVGQNEVGRNLGQLAHLVERLVGAPLSFFECDQEPTRLEVAWLWVGEGEGCARRDLCERSVQGVGVELFEAWL